MTRLPIPQSGPVTPATVRLGELAIAAGVAGFPVTVCYQGFPAPELAEVWKHHIGSVEAEGVYHIHTQRNVDKLPPLLAELRVVLVHAPRLHIPAAWSIQLASPAEDEGWRLPAMLSRFVPDDIEEESGATIVMHGTAQETAAIGQWLATQDATQHAGTLPPGPMTVDFPDWLSPVLLPDDQPNATRRRRFRDLRARRLLKTCDS